jgi:hypothetical protein
VFGLSASTVLVLVLIPAAYVLRELEPTREL